MNYYFIKSHTDLGPFNFAVMVEKGKLIVEQIKNMCKSRKLFVFSWSAEIIDENDYNRLMS